MPFLRALIFGAQPDQSGVFRVEKDPVEVTTVQQVFIQLSERLGVRFVRQDVPGLREIDAEPLQMIVNGKPAGLVGMYVERDGKCLFPRWSEEFRIGEDDTIVVSSLA